MMQSTALSPPFATEPIFFKKRYILAFSCRGVEFAFITSNFLDATFTIEILPTIDRAQMDNRAVDEANESNLIND